MAKVYQFPQKKSPWMEDKDSELRGFHGLINGLAISALLWGIIILAILEV